MAENAKQTRVNVIPTLRYRDAAAAIDWLCDAFGFERKLVVPGEDGAISHAQLEFGNGMLMVGSASQGGFDDLQKPPAEIDAVVTQSAYVVVDDVDAHHDRARAAGASIVMEVADQDHGGRLYSCRDPEGHLWSFGSYDPWADG
jgi:uncharacterized glyoxalase superfamily protein PhnB